MNSSKQVAQWIEQSYELRDAGIFREDAAEYLCWLREGRHQFCYGCALGRALAGKLGSFKKAAEVYDQESRGGMLGWVTMARLLKIDVEFAKHIELLHCRYQDSRVVVKLLRGEGP